MEKRVLILLIILCLMFASILKNYKISLRAAQTRTWIVDDDGQADFKTIQEAINNASSGDTIFVRNGTYYENVVINKSITLVGEHRDFTVINGNKTGHVVTIEADNVSIQGFTIMKSYDGQYGGIFIRSLSIGNVITNNKIIENSYGIYLYLSSNNNISNNLISNNLYGIGLTSCSNNFIFSNTIISNINDGINLFTSFNNFISYNVILHNSLNGISLYSSGDNLIHGNTISTNLFYGIFFYSSISNLISVNTITNNPAGGIVTVFSSNDNIFYHNNFDNIVQVYSKDSTNFWSCNNEGNYWSNYNGTDFYSGPNQDYPGSDGIGDIPYIIDEANVDGSPLMGMFHSFDITYKQKVYQVAIISNSTISDFQFQVGVETGNRIILFKPSNNENTVGFCRVMIPTEFMTYPYIILFGNEEISPSFLAISNETHVYLYFTYLHDDQMVTMISSEWYNELLNIYYDLNLTYYNLLNLYNDLLYDYALLLDNYTQLQKSFELLNASFLYFYDLNATFYNFLDDYVKLQENFDLLNRTYYNLAEFYWQLQINFGNLSLTYQSLLNAFVLLSGNYTQLQEDFQELNASYQDYMHSYSESVSNVKNLTYIIVAMTAVLIIVTTYLSKQVHSGGGIKIKKFGE
ncbi:MAG: pectinesterase family protein [Candidatus Bathyarchaeia archaeon]